MYPSPLTEFFSQLYKQIYFVSTRSCTEVTGRLNDRKKMLRNGVPKDT